MKTKVYFAHSKLIYDTPLEHRLIMIMKNAGLDVIDPNGDMGELSSITPYLEMVDKCDALVVHTTSKHYVGKGVYEEIKRAIAKKKPCHWIKNTKDLSLSLVIIEGVRVYDPMDWKKKYGTIIY